MSTRWALMSSRPSSNTANSPHGPAPMMSTSVLMGSVMVLAAVLQTKRSSPRQAAAKEAFFVPNCNPAGNGAHERPSRPLAPDLLPVGASPLQFHPIPPKSAAGQED